MKELLFHNLRVAIVEKGISYDNYCKYIGISNEGFRYRLTGEMEFTLREMEKTSELIPDIKWEELFRR